jgi:hypothetical protein
MLISKLADWRMPRAPTRGGVIANPKPVTQDSLFNLAAFPGEELERPQLRKAEVALPRSERPQVQKAGLALLGCAPRRNLKLQIEETKSQEPKFETRNGRRRHPKTGNLSDKEGAEMGRKRGIFGGFGRQKRGQKGEFGGPETGKKALFCVREGWEAGGEGFSGLNRTLCPKFTAPQNHPGGNARPCDR